MSQATVPQLRFHGYPLLFIQTSIAYLLLAAVCGVLMFDPATAGYFRFMHIHFIVLGFLIPMTSGLAYGILPQIGRPIRYPGLIAAQFWMANVGLIGKAISYSLRTEIGLIPFAICAMIVVSSIVIFAINMARTFK